MSKPFKKIYVEITNVCNLACSFCSVSKRPKRIMTPLEFEHVLKEVSRYTDYVYLHVKGEPLLHPQLDTLLSLCEKHNLKVNITTNGTLFPSVVSTLKKHTCLHQINFSLHSEQEDEMLYEQIFEGVDQLSTDIVIIYRFWALEHNKLNKKSTTIVDKLQKFYHLSPKIVEKIKKEKHIALSSHVFVDKQNRFEWPSLENGENQKDGYCYGLKSHIAILSDGTVVPCCLDGEGIITLGNIFQDSLVDILNSSRVKKIKSGFANRKATEELCRHCSYKNRF